MARRDEEPARRDVPLVRIFLSSPGDVAEERTLAPQLIDTELPKRAPFRATLQLVSVSWDDPAARSPMVATQPPQDSVNDARQGRVRHLNRHPVGANRNSAPGSVRKPSGEPYLSGTEWEYEDAVSSTFARKPVVLVYRRA